MERYFARDGSPLEMLEWAARKGRTDGYSIVGKDTIGESEISTVWLGLDHRHTGDGAPLIFETMIFGGALDGEQWRYSTEAEAIMGHARAMAIVTAGKPS